MTSAPRVLRVDAPERPHLERTGWVVVARSWGAGLDAAACDRRQLQALVARAEDLGGVRVLTPDDVEAVLALDAATTGHYPGVATTAHAPLTAASATVHAGRRAYGVTQPDGALAAMTFVDVADRRAEVDFTVVATEHRGRGLATAVKAASVLELLEAGVESFRTGGSADNPAILAANRAVGFVVDEEWVTLEPAGAGPGTSVPTRPQE